MESSSPGGGSFCRGNHPPKCNFTEKFYVLLSIMHVKIRLTRLSIVSIFFNVSYTKKIKSAFLRTKVLIVI